jgi:hypothetical protein
MILLQLMGFFMTHKNRNTEISFVLPSEVMQGAHPVFEEVPLFVTAGHIQLKLDLVENICDRFGKK